MRVALLGTGLIGGSIGLALRERIPSARVTLYDIDPATAREAMSRGVGERATATPAEAVIGADIVFVASPVRSIHEVIREALPGLRAGAVITDVGSTKARVVLEVEALLPPGVTFVGGHPMAGSEREGVGAAKADLFDGAWWILTPTERSTVDEYQVLHGVLTTLGARVMALNPTEHDDLMAVISHLPQLVASTLMNMAAERGESHAGLLALAAGGFRDVTRVAASNPDIWLDICRDNREAITSTLTEFAGRITGLRDLIDAESPVGLRDSLLAARNARRALPGARELGDLHEVRVTVPDRPGVLAEITTAIGNLGINIEDLQILHAGEGGQGTLRLAILGAVHARNVTDMLVARGFDTTAVAV